MKSSSSRLFSLPVVVFFVLLLGALPTIQYFMFESLRIGSGFVETSGYKVSVLVRHGITSLGVYGMFAYFFLRNSEDSAKRLIYFLGILVAALGKYFVAFYLFLVRTDISSLYSASITPRDNLFQLVVLVLCLLTSLLTGMRLRKI